jgi:hypothetical protein
LHPLAQCDCKNKKQLRKQHVTAIAKKIKNSCKNTGKKSAVAKKPVQKKALCHDTVRLRIGWCLLDVLQPCENTSDCNILYMWLQPLIVLRLQKI